MVSDVNVLSAENLSPAAQSDTCEDTINITINDSNGPGCSWLDIIAPSKLCEAIFNKIKAICESFQNLWWHGYKDKKLEREEKIANGIAPENSDFKIRISYTASVVDKTESHVEYRVGLFYASWPCPMIRDNATGEYVDMASNIVYDTYRDCVDTLATELKSELNALIA